jgi:cobalt-zinc-cadmium efflux system membrane fusion protein
VQFLGLPESLTRQFDPRTTTANLVPVAAPFDGTVVQADVIAGEVVEPGRVLFVVVDPSRLWLTLHVGPVDARVLSLGQPVRFRPDGGREEFEGRLSWVGTTVDETTRTVPVRAELANEAGRLRASTLGVGRVILREEPAAVVVPSEAVQADGGCQIVFVRDKDYLKPDAPKVFHARTVRTGARDGGNTEVIAGVLPGEVVAAGGSDVLLNELRKNQVDSHPATGGPRER